MKYALAVLIAFASCAPALAQETPMPGPNGEPGMWLRLELARDALAAYSEAPRLAEGLRLSLARGDALERQADALSEALVASEGREDVATADARRGWGKARRRGWGILSALLGGLATGLALGLSI